MQLEMIILYIGINDKFIPGTKMIVGFLEELKDVKMELGAKSCLMEASINTLCM